MEHNIGIVELSAWIGEPVASVAECETIIAELIADKNLMLE